jgi:hypothetical protein
MVQQYPSRQNLLKIADAAISFATALRNNWFLYDAPPGENPGYEFLPLNVDIKKPEHRNLFIRQLLNVLPADKNIKDLLAHVTPGNFLEGVPGADRLLRFYPQEISKTTIKGWPFEVNQAIAVLKDNIGTLSNWFGEGGFRPVPFLTVTTMEKAGIILRENAKAKKGDKPRITRDEANLRAREALKNTKMKWSERKLAKAIGCSPPLVHLLPAWRAHQEALTQQGKKKTPIPKAVGLTDKMLSTEGQNDPELERLISEHQADFEESPLISHARKYRRRRKV